MLNCDCCKHTSYPLHRLNAQNKLWWDCYVPRRATSPHWYVQCAEGVKKNNARAEKKFWLGAPFVCVLANAFRLRTLGEMYTYLCSALEWHSWEQQLMRHFPIRLWHSWKCSTWSCNCVLINGKWFVEGFCDALNVCSLELNFHRHSWRLLPFRLFTF